MMPFASIEAPSGPVLEFLVVFAVILFGPVVVRRLGLPGLIGLLVGGFAIGPHGLGLIAAGDQTVPALGQLGLLYLMFIAGLELDLHVLRERRNSAVALGLVAFAVPLTAGLVIGFALGWSVAATVLLGALFSSHTLIVYPTPARRRAWWQPRCRHGGGGDGAYRHARTHRARGGRRHSDRIRRHHHSAAGDRTRLRRPTRRGHARAAADRRWRDAHVGW